LDASAAVFVANLQDRTFLYQHTPSRSLPKETQVFKAISLFWENRERQPQM
jgi:hypothetical protein